MNTPSTPRSREVSLDKLRLPYAKGAEPLTKAEIAALTRQGIVRASHYIWLAERYMIDLSKLSTVTEMDDHLAALSDVAAYMERKLSGMMRR